MGKSSDEDGSSVPNNLNCFGRWQFRDINFHIGISIVSGPTVHSADGTDGVQSGKVEHTCVVDCTEGIQLGSTDIRFVLVMDSVLVKPVVNR